MTLLTPIFALPLLGALALVFLPRRYRVVPSLVAMLTTFLSMACAAVLFLRFDAGADGWQFETFMPWVPSVGIGWHVGVDGINVGLILMGAIVAFAAACVSWNVDDREKEFFILLQLMAGGILGAFASLDLFLFYFFHELALVPTFIMIGVWGRGENKDYAAFKITLYLSVGALISLVGLIALYLQTGAKTFDLVKLLAQAPGEGGLGVKAISPEAQHAIFPLLMFGFGILVSLWPFHSWAPPAYGAAPTAAAMLHAGVLKKFGLYGLIRVALPLLPEGAQSWLPLLAWLAVGNILYCGLVAMRQRDLNLLVGNSSVAHMGFAFLGIASLSVAGVTGAVMVMVAHGLLAALTFALTGCLYGKAGTLQIGQFGGLLRTVPFLGTLLVMAMFAGCGLPGFANFAGEIAVFFGVWPKYPVLAVVACWGGLVIGAVYMMRAVRDLLHGPARERWAGLSDANLWERVPLILLLLSLLAFGIVPGSLTEKIRPAAALVVERATGESETVTVQSGRPERAAPRPQAQAAPPKLAQGANIGAEGGLKP
jgi:NADH-quinone oxidoreductase subunit M